MKTLLAPKERFLLKQLTGRINKLTKILHQEGMSSRDIHQFFASNIFESQWNQKCTNNKLAKDLSSQTEEQTNSESSKSSNLSFETSIEKAIATSIKQGSTVEKVILKYIQNSYFQAEKLKNYLAMENSQESNKNEKFDFDRIKLRMQQKKYTKNSYQSIEDYILPKNQPSLSKQSSIKQKCFESKISEFQDSEQQLDYIRSFERSLNESIQKTRLLRSMLQKQLTSGLSLINRAPQEEQFQNEEIY